MFIFLKPLKSFWIEIIPKQEQKYKIIRHTLEMFKSILIPHLKIFLHQLIDNYEKTSLPIKYICENCMANNNAFFPLVLTFLEVKIIALFLSKSD